jgi:3-oxoacyl-[acyl-carrier-protein] synthase II
VSTTSQQRVVITGIGLVTPLGESPTELLRRIRAGDCSATPASFGVNIFACPVYGRVGNLSPQKYVSEAKMVRLMNRDAQLAVVAARRALEDAGLGSRRTYSPEEMGLFGATGLAGLPVREVAPLIRVSTDPDGLFDLTRFGEAGLKAVSPILSFKILANMPFCFVSINENIQGPNAIYTPWEGQGAQAIESGIRALYAGDARCVLVGGCDQKAHELGFASLQQHGLFSSWMKTGRGLVPAEGAAFLVLETEADAMARGAHIHACLSTFALRSSGVADDTVQARTEALRHLGIHEVEILVGSANGDEGCEGQEMRILDTAMISTGSIIYPKKHVGDLFAGAAALQIAVGAALIGSGSTNVLSTCFGHGSTQAAFVLERA